MTSETSAVLYVGIERSVVALDATTGIKRWSTPLPGAFFLTGFVTVHVDGAHVFAAAGGELTCLDAATGAIRWHNALEGYGVGFVTLATGDAGAAADAPSATEASVAAASFTAAAGAAAAAGGISAAL